MEKKPLTVTGRVRWAPSREIDHTTIRVLVVDDEEASRTATVELLTRQGHLIAATADSIASALAALRQGDIDVMVLDMHMPNPEGEPGDAGLVVLREMAKLEKKPWAFIYSPGISRRNARAARKFGALPFLNKARDWRKLSIGIVIAWTRELPPLPEMNGAQEQRKSEPGAP
jgi:DNA-binding NtrC family response regulator